MCGPGNEAIAILPCYTHDITDTAHIFIYPAALHHNLTRHNSEVESVIHTMHTTLLALDALVLNLTDHVQAVETLTLNASLAVNWIKSAHSAATYDTENALLVTLSNDMVEHSIAEITELSNANILNIVNTLHTQQMVAMMADEFEVSTLTDY